jgi:hypothetical protein
MTDETREADPPKRSRAQLEDALKVAKIRLEQSVKRLGGEIEPVPWGDVAAQATAAERGLIEFTAEIMARIAELPAPAPDAQEAYRMRVLQFREMIAEHLALSRLEVELEAAEKTVADLLRMELSQGGAPMPRPRRVQ